MFGELINTTTRDGIRLDGIWSRPSKDGASQLGVEVMILLHGVAENFYGPGIFDDFGDALLKRGCAVLRVNNRGHDPVGQVVMGDVRTRVGGAYENVDDCRFDWEAWVTFAQACGYQEIGLWGHSLGATKSIYYMAVHHDSRVKCVVASSPPLFSCSIYLESEVGEQFKSLLYQAQGHVDAGHPKALIEVTHPYPLLIAAEVYIAKYGPQEKYNILKHIPHVRSPLLITLGTQEAQERIAFRPLPQELRRLETQLENLKFESIPDADHFYTHQRDYVWRVVSPWLEKV